MQGLFWTFSLFPLSQNRLSPPLQQGQVDCWPLPCPPVDCEFTVVPEGECCPRCVTDPCQADTIRNDITKTCTDEHNISRFSGSSWIKHGTECTLCQCKVRRQPRQQPQKTANYSSPGSVADKTPKNNGLENENSLCFIWKKKKEEYFSTGVKPLHCGGSLCISSHL